MGVAPHLILVGIPGSGKTTIGREAARRLRWPFLDLDEEISAREGMSVRDIFAQRGESHFRALEREATMRLAQIATPMIVAPGGGWITVPGLIELVRPPAELIWLKASPQVALARMGAEVAARPLLAGPAPLGALAGLAAARESFYLQSNHTLSVDLMTVDEVADSIVVLARP